MGPSKRKSRQMSDVPDEPEEPYYSVRGILDENKTKYLVDWEDIGSTKYPPSWEPKGFVTGDVVQEWEEEKKQKQLAEERKKKRKSIVQIDDDDEEEPRSQKRPPTTNTASGSGSKPKPSLKLSFGKQKPVVEIEAPTAKVSEPVKRKPGRPRKSEVSIVQPEEDEDDIAPPSVKRGRGRPRKSNPVIEVDPKEKEQDDDDEDSEHQSVKLYLGKVAKPGPSTGLKRKRNVGSSKVVDISSDDDSDVPIRTQIKRRRTVVPDSSEEAQLAHKEVQCIATPKKRGRPRKYPIPGSVASIPVTPVVTASVGTTEIEDSEIFDAAAAQLQREVRSARKRSPGRQPSPRQSPARQPSPEFDEGVSDFRSSQIVKGTQPEPPRTEQENESLEELPDSQSMIDAAAASSLSAKNSAYEPSGSIFDEFTNSSSGVHTIPNFLVRRFGPDAVISDSQSYLDASSVHISEQRTQAEVMHDQMEISEDATTESQIIVEHEVTEQMITQDLPVPESSIAQVRHTPPLAHSSITILLGYFVI